MAQLPIIPFRAKLVSELARAGALILSAPTGSGKSTQVPQFLLGATKGRVLVLEPRRLSARSLAVRVARELKTPLGTQVGYQVRFDSVGGKDTRLFFQTYGVFVAQLLADPSLPDVEAVVLDEFHERTLEADLALAWLAVLRKRRPELKLVVMSATLEAAQLASLLPDAARLDVPGRLFPVDVRHKPRASTQTVEQAALEALRELSLEGLDGSVLIFMPGLREIRRSLTLLGPYCREMGLDLKSLHGSMELSEQQGVLDEGGRPRVIVATNVAETGLTIPGVTAVIDSGLHRLAAYDAARGINTLYLSRISRANADQRSGRAGRTAPGRCVRLWSRGEESGMAASLAPEVARLELSSLRLEAASLPEPVAFPTPPKDAAWEAAGSGLRALGALDEKGAITARGRALLTYPAHPRVAAVLETARGLGAAAYDRAAAMAAVFESDERRPDQAADVSALAEELRSGGGRDWEAARVFEQLKRLGRDAGGKEEAGALERAWLSAFADRLGAREGEAFYRLLDGRGVLLPNVKAPPAVLLALDARERAGGGQARQVAASLYLPLTVEHVRAAFPGEAAWKDVSEFDAKQQRVVKERRLMFRGLALERKEATHVTDKKATAELWAEQFASGELRHPGFDEKVEQLLARIAVARRHYPDWGLPELSRDDWRLIYSEVCARKNSLKDIEREPLAPHILDYIGRPLADALDRALPTHKKLPSGRLGRYTYFESRPPELSARLGDFVGLTGTLSLCEGRLPVLFDILAPNYRTVQKTHDLSSFWANTYPEVKKELKRRYPKHPWP